MKSREGKEGKSPAEKEVLRLGVLWAGVGLSHGKYDTRRYPSPRFLVGAQGVALSSPSVT